MNLLFEKIILSVILSLFITANLLSQDIPDRNSEWMLLTSNDKHFYLNGFNKTYVWTDSMIVYNSRNSEILRQPQPVLLIKDGIAEGITKHSNKLAKDSLAIAGKWDSLEWLRTNINEGDEVRIVPSTPFLPFSITFPIDKVDKGIVKDGTLAVFTPRFGPKTPSTIYRQQAVISKGRVIEKTGGNAFIPSDGFVLSGHGTGYFPAGASRILRWVGLGCKVQLSSDKKSFTVITDRETWFLRAESYLKKAKQFAFKNNNLLELSAKTKSREYINASSQMLKLAKTAKHHNNNQAAWSFIKQSLAFSETAMITASLPVTANSIRSAAVSGPISAQAIEIIREAGFNTILLHYGKRTISRLPELLKTAKLAREHGLKIFLWTWLPSGFPLPLQVKEKLSQDLDKDGKPTGFVDLSVPQNRQMVCKELIRACELFDADGVMFDYESYKGGYGKESIKRFCKEQNIPIKTFDIANIPAGMTQKWEMWKRNNLKLMLFSASKALHEASRPRKAALCVFPCGVGNVKSLKEGNTAKPGPAVWLDWLKTPHFDIVQFMFYSQDITWLQKRTNVLFPLLRANNKKLQIESWLIYWPEICGWSNPVPIDNLLRQSDVMIKAGSDGVSFFSSSNINALWMPYFETFFNAMRNGIYRLAPHKKTPSKIKPTKKSGTSTPDHVWKSNFIKSPSPIWEYYQFGTSAINPLTLELDKLLSMKYRDKSWKSRKAGKHGHPVIFRNEFDNPALSYVAQKISRGYGYWSAIGFRAPEKGKYSISGEIKFQRYKNGTALVHGNVEVILFSSGGARIKCFRLKSGKSSSISENLKAWKQNLPIDGIEMNKNDLLLFRPFTEQFNANVPFQAVFELTIQKRK